MDPGRSTVDQGDAMSKWAVGTSVVFILMTLAFIRNDQGT